MNSSLRKIGILIAAIIVLPVVVFSVFELGNQRKNEKVIQEIYTNQLEAILFSINQYSDDIMSNLASRIENICNNTGTKSKTRLNRRMEENGSITNLFQFNSNLELQSVNTPLNSDTLALSKITAL